VNIIFFSHYFVPEVNAPANRTYANCKRWAKAGHRVTIITSVPNCPRGKVYPGYRNRRIQREKVDGIEVVRVWTFIAANQGTLFRIVNYLSYFVSSVIAAVSLPRPDAVIATSPQFFCGWAGLWAARLKNVPFILEIRDIWPESIKAVGALRSSLLIRALEHLELKMYRGACKIIAVGEGYREILLSKGVAPDKVEVIPNGVDRELFSPREPDRDLERALDAKGAFICAYVGTIGMACGLEIVLDAAQILLETGRNDILFLLVGDGAQKSELERKARERGLNNVRFTGQVSREEVPAYLSISGVVLVHLKKTPLFTTVMPSKIFEAAGMKKPIICGVAGKAAALIAKAEAGVNITPGSAEELAAAVVDLADQPDKRESFGEQGYRYIVSRFDREELADRYLEIIVRTMEKPSNV